jgi:hypothetical protein
MVQGRKTFDVANGVTGLSEKYHHVMALTARNQISGFAAKTRKNLDFIISSRANGADVHEVTQLMLSLLGLIVFPKEKGLDERVESAKINTLAEQGWPLPTIQKGMCSTLGCLIHHLRNAIAHRHVVFSSNDPDMANVEIYFEDYYPNAKRPHWKATFQATELRSFCDHFIDLMNGVPVQR